MCERHGSSKYEALSPVYSVRILVCRVRKDGYDEKSQRRKDLLFEGFIVPQGLLIVNVWRTFLHVHVGCWSITSLRRALPQIVKGAEAGKELITGMSWVHVKPLSESIKTPSSWGKLHRVDCCFCCFKGFSTDPPPLLQAFTSDSWSALQRSLWEHGLVMFLIYKSRWSTVLRWKSVEGNQFVKTVLRRS